MFEGSQTSLMRSEGSEPKPLLSTHSTYMCTAVGIVVAIGFVIACRVRRHAEEGGVHFRRGLNHAPIPLGPASFDRGPPTLSSRSLYDFATLTASDE
ncbi:hypothetical protein HPB50_026705 [Hyalomma asiaticum]|uniref:Uncharacterized protein n=1 Tax=Hyalomma asiaticum TaxID=266040 RepID=A0ACB7SD84_HYAAI|nr:hypothetical protein HPB50_026705 [Hyalomma asiaticum]